jgi:hypothetical protein
MRSEADIRKALASLEYLEKNYAGKRRVNRTAQLGISMAIQTLAWALDDVALGYEHPYAGPMSGGDVTGGVTA